METLPNELKCLIMSYAHPIHPCKDELTSIFDFYGESRWMGFLQEYGNQANDDIHRGMSEGAMDWCFGDDCLW